MVVTDGVHILFNFNTTHNTLTNQIFPTSLVIALLLFLKLWNCTWKKNLWIRISSDIITDFTYPISIYYVSDRKSEKELVCCVPIREQDLIL